MDDLLFKWTREKGQSIYTDYVYPLPTKSRPGKWTPSVADLKLCQSGYHVVNAINILLFISVELYLVEVKGRVIVDTNKSTHESVRLTKKLAWNKDVAVMFAADCAEHVLHLFESKYPNDSRPRLAIEAARNKNANAAANAANAAAYAATEKEWQSKKLLEYVM